MAEGDIQQQQETPSPGPVVQEQPIVGANDPDELGIDPQRLMAVLAYMGFLVFVPLIMSRKDPFVMIHVKQGLVILVGYALALLLVFWVSAVGSILFILLLLASVGGAVAALAGSRWKIPLIGHLAAMFTI